MRCARRCPQAPPHQVAGARPVCGADGNTYKSACHLRLAACRAGRAIPVAYKGHCKRESFSLSFLFWGGSRGAVHPFIFTESFYQSVSTFARSNLRKVLLIALKRFFEKETVKFTASKTLSPPSRFVIYITSRERDKYLTLAKFLLLTKM